MRSRLLFNIFLPCNRIRKFSSTYLNQKPIIAYISKTFMKKLAVKRLETDPIIQLNHYS